MSWLILSPGHKIKVGFSFEHPDDQFIAMTADPETMAEAASGLMKHERDEDAIDRELGMRSTPMATIAIMTKPVIGEDKVLFMTADELRRHIYECRAILKTMDKSVELVDSEMAGYRREIRARQ